MNVLVLNSGSSSLKFQVIESKYEQILIKGVVEAIGLPNCAFKYEFQHNKKVIGSKMGNHEDAVKLVLNTVDALLDLETVKAIGHRVVHGGEYYKDPVIITGEVTRRIRELIALAPLHNPHNLAGILACKKLLPKLPQVAMFDTGFHARMPKHAFLYAIPYTYYNRFKIRKYGFHGTSHKYVSIMAKRLLGLRKCNLVTCHLGNGSSITAVENGRSIDTSMGFTPLQGIMMGTRSGHIDPSIVAYLSERLKLKDDKIINILNKKSGLLGICGYSDMRVIHEKAIHGHEKCRLALDMLSYKLAKHIGSYMAVLPSVDAIVFTAGIGENAHFIRKKACDMLRHFGVKIDHKKNRLNKEIDISARDSNIKVLVIPTNEEMLIAKETVRLIR